MLQLLYNPHRRLSIRKAGRSEKSLSKLVFFFFKSKIVNFVETLLVMLACIKREPLFRTFVQTLEYLPRKNLKYPLQPEQILVQIKTLQEFDVAVSV